MPVRNSFMSRPIKRLIKGILKMSGYEVIKTVGRGEYTLHYPFGDLIYSPWFENWFQDIYKKINQRTLIWEDRAYIINRFCSHCIHLEGDFAECGVYKGGSAFLIADTIKPLVGRKKLYLFDTFTGMPDTAIKQKEGFQKGDLGDTSLNDVKVFLKEFSFINFHAGFIPDTFVNQKVEESRFSFVHLDVDIYQSTLDCCQFFYDRMVKGGVLLCDDYGVPIYKNGARAAFDLFFDSKPETPIVLPTGQCLVVKL